jgi:hypothetical protein
VVINIPVQSVATVPSGDTVVNYDCSFYISAGFAGASLSLLLFAQIAIANGLVLSWRP